MTEFYYALRSLTEGHWFKLICGASFQHLPAVRNLTLAYTLAGADCIDVAADPAVIACAQEALAVATQLMDEGIQRGFGSQRQLPWLMVSLNDGEDPHFRKAEFNQSECPPDCHRPCEQICPAGAIVFGRGNDKFSGVVSESCYGCGRCLPICPSDIIYTRSYVTTPEAIAPLVLSTGVDAVEIHTQVGRLSQFKRLWANVAPWVDRLKLVAISCPDGDDLIEYLSSLTKLISPLPCPLIWQTDGRPMSGDIGDGTTLAAVKLGQKVLAANLPGYVQLAGGTNGYTVAKLKAMGLLNDFRLPILDFGLQEQSDNPKSRHFDARCFNGADTSLNAGNPRTGDVLGNPTPVRSTGETPARDWLRNALASQVGKPAHASGSKIQNPKSHIAGVAYGSFARVLLSPILNQLEQMEIQANGISTVRLEEKPELLWQAVELAYSLVSQLKSS